MSNVQELNPLDLLEKAGRGKGANARPSRSGQGQGMVKSFNQLAREHNMPDYTGDAAVAQIQATLNQAMGKSLGVNNGSGIQGTQSIHLENLDMTLTQVLFTEQWLLKTNAIPRVPSKNVNYEYTRKKGYGSHRGTAGFAEGGAPYGSDPTYERLAATVRYMGERGGVTHQAAMSAGGMQLDPTAEANRDAAIRLMAKIERNVLWSQEAIKDVSDNVVNYDGIYAQMLARYPQNIIDNKGLPLTYNTMENIGYNLFENGRLNSFSQIRNFSSPFVVSDMAALKRDSERSVLATDGKGMLIPGTPIGGYQTQFGFLPLQADTFLDEVQGGLPLSVADAGAPVAPATPTGVAATNAASLMTAGTYTYRAAAFNEKGESITAASAGIVVASGEQANISIPRVAGAVGYRLYRGAAGETNIADARWIATIPQTVSGPASFSDVNAFRPKTGFSLFFNANPADIAIAQLSPLIKYPLALVNTTAEFLLLLYHTIVVKAPERLVLVKNIGRS